MHGSKPLFFTSIPKAGKNLIYSFLDGLGYQRSSLDRSPAVWSTEEPWLRKFRRRQTYALPPPSPERGATLRRDYERFLEGVGKMSSGEVLHHHLPYDALLAETLERSGVVPLFVVRDPRDLLLSMADYILIQGKPQHLAATYHDLKRGDLIIRLWQGDRDLISLREYYASFCGWRNRLGVLTLRFEDLIGAQGGGSAAAQRDSFRFLADRLTAVSPERFSRACDQAYNPRAGTFFLGQSGRWRQETAAEVRALMQGAEMSQFAASWGYTAI